MQEYEYTADRGRQVTFKRDLTALNALMASLNKMPTGEVRQFRVYLTANGEYGVSVDIVDHTTLWLAKI